MNTRFAFLCFVCSLVCCRVALASWWDSSYSYQTEISLSTGSALSSEYSIHVQMDLDTLVADGKVKSDFEDVRVVYFDGSTYTELDRHIRQASTGYDIWFQLQNTKGANDSSSGEYFVYYGNSTAADAPKDYSNVYLLYDDFSGTSLSSNWYGNTHYYSVSNGSLVIPAYNGNGSVMYTDLFTRNSVREYSLKVSSLYGRGQLYIHSLGTAVLENDWGNGNRIVHDLDGANPTTNSVRMDNTTWLYYLWPHSTSDFQVFQDVILGNTQTYYAGDDYASLTEKATCPTSNSYTNASFKINSQWTKQTWYMDYVLIRENVETAPLVLLGVELTDGVIPEPISIVLFGLGIACRFILSKRRK